MKLTVTTICVLGLIGLLPIGWTQEAKTQRKEPPVVYGVQFPVEVEWEPVPKYSFGKRVHKLDGTFIGYHLGDDIACASGTVVYPMADGIVRYADIAHPGISGYTVVIEHNIGGEYVTTVYYHMKTRKHGGKELRIDTPVSMDDTIGYISDRPEDHGNTFPHLHFGIRKGASMVGKIEKETGRWYYTGYTKNEKIVREWYNPSEFIPKKLSLFPIREGSVWGYIDRRGKVVIKPQFDAASEFSENLAAVDKDGRWGYIDKTGTFVVEPQFDEAGDFSEGLAFVGKDDRLGYIDQSGKYAIELEFDFDVDWVGEFSEGLAYIGYGHYEIAAEGYESGRFGYIDKKGNLVIQPQFSFAFDFSNGLARVNMGGRLGVGLSLGMGGKWGYIDKTGKPLSKTQIDWAPFDHAFDFSEGLAAVRKFDKWGYIDTTGKFAIQPQFDWAFSFSNGLARVNMGGNLDRYGSFVEGGRWGYIDKTGKFVIGLRFDDARDFSDGLAAVRDGGKWGYIDQKGKFVIQPQFDEAWDFCEGLARVTVGGKPSYINRKGRIVWPKT